MKAPSSFFKNRDPWCSGVSIEASPLMRSSTSHSFGFALCAAKAGCRKRSKTPQGRHKTRPVCRKPGSKVENDIARVWCLIRAACWANLSSKRQTHIKKWRGNYSKARQHEKTTEKEAEGRRRKRTRLPELNKEEADLFRFFRERREKYSWWRRKNCNSILNFRRKQ